MAIRSPAQTKHVSILDTPAARKVASRAPDYTPAGVMKGSKRQISLTIAPALLVKLDALAVETGLSRAYLINLAVKRALESGTLNLISIEKESANG
jgi:hypothetical protein